MNSLNDFYDYRSRIVRRAFLTVLTLMAGLMLAGQGQVAYGVFFGGLLSIIIFQLIFIKINFSQKLKESQPKKTFTFFFIAYIIAYLIMAATLYVALKKGLPVFFGVATGLLVVKITIYIDGLMQKLKGRFMDGVELLRLVALVGAGLCMGLGAIGPAIGTGITGAVGTEAIGKKEETQGPVLKTMLIGMAIASGNGIFALVIALLLLYVVT